jgi:hypothetical protein
MKYIIEINVLDVWGEITKTIRGDELSGNALNLIDAEVSEILNDMSFKTRNILTCLEAYERYLNDLDGTLAYSEQVQADKKTLSRAIDELEALL